MDTINSIFFSLKYIKNEKSLKYLKGYLKNLYLSNKNFYDNSLSVGVLNILDELMLEDISPVNINNNFAKVFPKTDKAIAQVNGVGIGISLSSTRQGKYESINQENMKGWYQGDGMTYVYLSPDDYASQFYQNANPYRLPGTTVTTAPRELVFYLAKKLWQNLILLVVLLMIRVWLLLWHSTVVVQEQTLSLV